MDTDVDSNDQHLAALQREEARLVAELRRVREDIALVRAGQDETGTAAWSKTTVTLDDVEQVMALDRDAEWTVAAIQERLPGASTAQIRARLNRMAKRGLARVPQRGRWMLAPLSPAEHAAAHAVHAPGRSVRARVMDLVDADPQRAWTRERLAEELQDVSHDRLRAVLNELVSSYALMKDGHGWYRKLPAEVRVVFDRRQDAVLHGPGEHLTKGRDAAERG